MTEEPKKVQCADCDYARYAPMRALNGYVCHCIASSYYDRLVNGFEKHECERYKPHDMLDIEIQHG